MHIVVYRFSSLGDVALSIPIIYTLLEQNPNLQITYFTKKPFTQLFHKKHKRLSIIGWHFQKGLRGFGDIFQIYIYILSLKAEAIVDIHSVLRSLILSYLLKLSGKKVLIIKKNRKERKILLKGGKIKLKRIYKKYLEPFEALGLKIEIHWKLKPLKPQKTYHIGVAPFASNQGKTYPTEKLFEAIYLVEKAIPNISFLFFGNIAERKSLLKPIKKIKNGKIISQKNLSEELKIISELDLMISMDSANMHLASLCKVPAISIWGATHHSVGFLGIGQSVEDIVEFSQKELPCRPCSIFGTNTCKLDNSFKCLTFAPQKLAEKIIHKLNFHT